MKERRTPILGDEVYGTAEWNTRYRRTHQVRRPLLHAYESDFLHPFTGEKISLKAPIPADMASIINKIASHSGMNLEENENLHSVAGYSIVDPVTGLLTCDTYVNEPLLGEQPQLETVGTNTNPQTNKVKGLHPVGQFVPIERVVLREEVWPMGALVTTGDDEEEGEGEHDKDPFVWAD